MKSVFSEVFEYFCAKLPMPLTARLVMDRALPRRTRSEGGNGMHAEVPRGDRRTARLNRHSRRSRPRSQGRGMTLTSPC